MTEPAFPINKHGVPGTGEVLEVPIHHRRPIRVVCIGAGIAGLYVAIKLPRSTENVELKVYEKNDGIGGVWWENRYPGCACDIPAHVYTYSFESNPDFPRFLSSAASIREYLNKTANKYDAMKYIHLRHKIIEAVWDEQAGVYNLVVETPNGLIKDQCEVLINASGMLNAWKWPSIPDMDKFQGKLIHTANWDPDVDLKDKRVGLIGSGSSAVQLLPGIMEDCKEIVTYITNQIAVTPGNLLNPFAEKPEGIPSAHYLAQSCDYAYTEEQLKEFKKNPQTLMEHRRGLETFTNKFFPVLMRGPANAGATEAFAMFMRIRLAKKPEVAEAIIPKWGMGCRRITPAPHYLEALCDDKVTVHTAPIKSFTATGMLNSDGTQEDLDVIICATGFDVTFKPRFKLVGKDGYTVPPSFAEEPKAYMAFAYKGLPNYFHSMGPNLPIINGSFIPCVEKQIDYFVKAINKLQRQNIRSMLIKPECVDEFSAHVDAYMKRTVFTDPCRSWYKNNTVDGRVTAAWPGSSMHFMETVEDPRWEDYTYTYVNPTQRFDYIGNGVSQLEERDGDVTWYLREKL